MSAAFPWNELGIAATPDSGAIRRAYAARLKAMDAELEADAFERLRQARDMALRQAKTPPGAPAPDLGDVPDVADVAVPDPPAEPAPWAYAAPTLPRTAEAWRGDAVAPAPRLPAALAHRAIAPGFVAAAPATGGLAMAYPFVTPVVAGQAGDVGPIPRPDARLYHLLLANGAEDDTPLSEADGAEAMRCLRWILADAAAGDLARHDAAEAWLADLLRKSWPRCAPLLEEIATRFGWAKRAGQLGESKAMAFLNARLAGYLFQRDVQAPGHPLHKAWAELSRPGPAGPKRFLPTKAYSLKRQVIELLTHIRRHFSEIESFLDPRRVASWEASVSAPRQWRLLLRWPVLLVVVVLRVMIGLGHDFGENSRPPGSLTTPSGYNTPFAGPSLTRARHPIVYDPSETPALTRAKQAAVAEAFGPGKTLAWLRPYQPDLARWIAGYASSPEPSVVARAIAWEVQRRIYVAALLDGGAELDAAMRLRAATLAAADKQGNAACDMALRVRSAPDAADVPPAMRRARQELAARMAEAGKLSLRVPPANAGARVPGVLVEQVVLTTGLDHARIVDAMRRPDAPRRCAVEAALIGATLAWHGPDRGEILRAL